MTGPRWSATRLVQAAGLGAWAATFWILLLMGRVGLYLSPRIAWVVPVGAIGLTFAAVVRLATARSRASEPATFATVGGTLIMIAPVILLLSLPPTTLDSFAADRRASVTRVGWIGNAQFSASGGLTMLDLASAQTTPEGQRALIDRAGDTVTLEGFLGQDDTPVADQFYLDRFFISCCVADALLVRIRVVNWTGAGSLSRDSWYRVTGAVYPVGREVLVVPTQVRSIPQPADPYLSP